MVFLLYIGSMKETYSIYIGRLPSGKWKVGCDINYPNRPKQQKMKIYTCIETHDCIYKASDREIELQIKYFGKRDSNASYHEIVKRAEQSAKKRIGKPLLEETKAKMSKARQGTRISEETKALLLGSKNHWAKLTEVDVLEIRSKYIPRVYTLQMLADEYGVDESAIFCVVKRQKWKHI